ncbi:MAG: DNA-binding response regulator, partial [Bacillota bacterium]
MDDHRIVREGLKFLLVAEEDLEVAGEADSGIEALRMVEKLKPHVV